MDALIPGLPNEIARECLSRVPYTSFPTVGSVCKLWRDEIGSPAFHLLRKANGLTRTVIALTQIELISRHGPKKHSPAAAAGGGRKTIAYRLALYEPDTGAWDAPPAIPCLPRGLPLFCQVAGAGRNLVVVGGWDPDTWSAIDGVFVYDFASAGWRRGARMPGPRRSFFACASSGDRRMVFVAGGHDEDKNALRSALAYDVARNEWLPLPDMARERDECVGVFRRGAFHVIGGYATETQGRFGRCSEAFDVATWRWGPVEPDTLGDTGLCPRSCCVAGDEGTLYRCTEGRVEVRDGATWRSAAELPGGDGQLVAPCVVVSLRRRGKLMVIGSGRRSRPELMVHTLELGQDGKGCGSKWVREAPPPEEYSGHVQAGCCLEI